MTKKTFFAASVALVTALTLGVPASAQALPLGSSGLGSSTLPGYPLGADREWVSVGERARDYLISSPVDFDPERTYPVLFVFPGLNVSPENMIGDTGLNREAEAFVVHARGVDGAWAGAPYSVADMDEDIAYVRAVVDQLAEQHPQMDADRVYALGHSNGGGFAVSLACHAPDLVAGVMGVAGAYYEPFLENCVDGSSVVPALVMHSPTDGLIEYDGGVRHDTAYVGAREAAARLAELNNCEEGVTGVGERERGQNCDAEMELLTGGTGHGWSVKATNVAREFFFQRTR